MLSYFVPYDFYDPLDSLLWRLQCTPHKIWNDYINPDQPGSAACLSRVMDSTNQGEVSECSASSREVAENYTVTWIGIRISAEIGTEFWTTHLDVFVFVGWSRCFVYVGIHYYSVNHHALKAPWKRGNVLNLMPTILKRQKNLRHTHTLEHTLPSNKNLRGEVGI